MGFVTTFLIGFALAMDAFAVSITKGITLRKINTALSFKIAFFFGLFQGFMPFIGWLVGIRFQSYITFIDHWIALFLLSFIGLKMIFEAYEDNKNPEISVTCDDELDNKSSISNNTSENQAATEPDEFNELDDELNDDTFDNIEVNNDSLNSNKYNSEKDSAIVEEHFSFLKKASDKSDVNTSTEDTDFLDDELDEI